MIKFNFIITTSWTLARRSCSNLCCRLLALSYRCRSHVHVSHFLDACSRGGEFLPRRELLTRNHSLLIHPSLYSAVGHANYFPHLPWTVAAIIASQFIRVRVYLIRVSWQGQFQCSGGDSVSNQESGGKGRQLATSILFYNEVTFEIWTTNECSKQKFL